MNKKSLERIESFKMIEELKEKLHDKMMSYNTLYLVAIDEDETDTDELKRIYDHIKENCIQPYDILYTLSYSEVIKGKIPNQIYNNDRFDFIVLIYKDEDSIMRMKLSKLPKEIEKLYYVLSYITKISINPADNIEKDILCNINMSINCYNYGEKLNKNNHINNIRNFVYGEDNHTESVKIKGKITSAKRADDKLTSDEIFEEMIKEENDKMDREITDRAIKSLKGIITNKLTLCKTLVMICTRYTDGPLTYMALYKYIESEYKNNKIDLLDTKSVNIKYVPCSNEQLEKILNGDIDESDSCYDFISVVYMTESKPRVKVIKVPEFVNSIRDHIHFTENGAPCPSQIILNELLKCIDNWYEEYKDSKVLCDNKLTPDEFFEEMIKDENDDLKGEIEDLLDQLDVACKSAIENSNTLVLLRNDNITEEDENKIRESAMRQFKNIHQKYTITSYKDKSVPDYAEIRYIPEDILTHPDYDIVTIIQDNQYSRCVGVKKMPEYISKLQDKFGIGLYHNEFINFIKSYMECTKHYIKSEIETKGYTEDIKNKLSDIISIIEEGQKEKMKDKNKDLTKKAVAILVEADSDFYINKLGKEMLLETVIDKLSETVTDFKLNYDNSYTINNHNDHLYDDILAMKDMISKSKKEEEGILIISNYDENHISWKRYSDVCDVIIKINLNEEEYSIIKNRYGLELEIDDKFFEEMNELYDIDDSDIDNDEEMEDNKDLTKKAVAVLLEADSDNHSIFLLNDGTVKACGNNHFGHLGIGTIISRPVRLNIETDFDLNNIVSYYKDTEDEINK